jgi:subtilisin family serine protease
MMDLGAMRFLLASVFLLASLPSAGLAQEALIAALTDENNRLRAELAELQGQAPAQCTATNAATDATTLLMRKLSALQDAAALTALGGQHQPLVLPDVVLSSLVPDQYILTYVPGLNLTTAQAVALAFDLAPEQIIFTYSTVIKGFSANLTEADRQRLTGDPRIETVTQDGFIFPAETAPGSQNPAPQIPGPDQPTAWAKPGSAPVDVYVFDSGIRAGHDALAGRVGLGFTSFRNGIGTEDCNGHGTHVAASIGGRQFGQTDGARLISVKVIDRDSYGDTSTLIAGVEWVLAQPGSAKLVNMSLTRMEPAPPGDALLDRAVQALLDAGIPVIVAAGNAASDARLYTPARVPGVITVGAMDGDQVDAQSNSGEGVDLYTQGSNVISASIDDTCAEVALSGTSMATSRVTGLAARMMQDGVSAADLDAALKARSVSVETGEFIGEESRYVLAIDPADGSKICNGLVIQAHSPPSP